MADRTRGREWPASLDVDALRTSGWRPTPFRHFVLKVASRCNLACDYCYVYEAADQGWRDQPRVMSAETARTVASRIAEHAAAHGLDRVEVVLHGGEPLLAGTKRISEIVRELRAACGRTRVDVGLQTNGVLLTDATLAVLAEHDIRVGVSLDGAPADNDRHRRHADGRGSATEAHAGLARLTAPRYRRLFNGLLSTIDLRNEPVSTYDALLEFAPPSIDFLLPHGTWDAPPPGRSPDSPATPYGDWLIEVFDRWYRAPRRETRVRLFGEIIRLLAGQPSRTEAVGLSPVALIVVETDGSIEQVDTLKTAYAGAAATGLHLADHGFDEALGTPGVAARQLGLEALSGTCRSCSLVRVCGGGMYSHRHGKGNGFRNPSVYCPDLAQLIRHIRAAVAGDLVRARERGPRVEIQTRHTLPAKAFTALAEGGGGAHAIDHLRTAQYSKRLLLLHGVLGSVGDDATGRGAKVRHAYALLAEIQHQSPEAVDTVLRYPSLGGWATEVLSGKAGPEGLAAVTAAAAVHARREAVLTIPVRDGWAVLPSLGRALMPGCTEARVSVHADGRVVVAGRTGEIEVPADPHRDAPGWQGVRRLEAVYRATSLRLLFDDHDPHRLGGTGVCDARPADEELERWRRLLREAWRLLVLFHPTAAEETAAVLTTLTPMPPAETRFISATAEQTFGAVGMSMPPDEHSMAVTLVHEVQHAKLGAICDIVPLTQPDDGSRYYAPWRADPRPAVGLLHGVYAHLGVAGFWRRQRLHETGTHLRRAESQFVHWRDASALVAGTLAKSGQLTAEGERLLAGVSRVLASWQDEPVDASIQESVRARAARHHRAFRAEHGDVPGLPG